jgi:hypothetical protein
VPEGSRLFAHSSLKTPFSVDTMMGAQYHLQTKNCTEKAFQVSLGQQGALTFLQ